MWPGMRAWTQAKLAENSNFRPRVSQILRRVAEWRVGFGPQAAASSIMRAAAAGAVSGRGAESGHPTGRSRVRRGAKELTASKSGERDGKKFSEESRREVQRPAGLLRIALRASENLAKAAELPAPPSPQDPVAEEQERERTSLTWLCERRMAAEAALKVPRSVEHRGDNYWPVATVEHWFGALIGEEPSCRADPIHFGPGTPLAELSRFYYPNQDAAVGCMSDAKCTSPSEVQCAPLLHPTDDEAVSNAYIPNVDETSQVVDSSQVAADAPPSRSCADQARADWQTAAALSAIQAGRAVQHRPQNAGPAEAEELPQEPGPGLSRNNIRLICSAGRRAERRLHMERLNNETGPPPRPALQLSRPADGPPAVLRAGWSGAMVRDGGRRDGEGEMEDGEMERRDGEMRRVFAATRQPNKAQGQRAALVSAPTTPCNPEGIATGRLRLVVGNPFGLIVTCDRILGCRSAHPGLRSETPSACA
jgi:hypothetical protein